jgi:hypothetical protein
VVARLLLATVAAIWIAPRAAAAEDFARRTLSVEGGEVELLIEQAAGARASTADVERWVRRAGVAVARFYGRFPVARVKVVVARVPGRRIGGTAYGGHLVRMRLGLENGPARLEDDWTMTHELLHVGFPDLDRRHLWMQEGMATYFEPIARARVGDLPAERVWREMMRDLPKGLPGEGERGLDRTGSWASTYWGGALFWFLADVEIRQRTRNRKSADDVLRAIAAAGGNGSQDWPIERVLAVGDRATGTNVMRSLYRRLGQRRFEVDLDAMAARLGVSDRGFDDRAPLAAIRRSITEPGQRRGMRPGPPSVGRPSRRAPP